MGGIGTDKLAAIATICSPRTMYSCDMQPGATENNIPNAFAMYSFPQFARYRQPIKKFVNNLQRPKQTIPRYSSTLCSYYSFMPVVM
jgi:hypothetical protein